jgi:hypothetical protein
VIRQTADLGGHLVGVSGSGAMYDTLVNLHSGPRVLGQTYTMHAIEGSKHPLVDSLSAFSNGFGGDPTNFARLSFYKGKRYEFTGTFRRDRQYFDYDLLANPSIPAGVGTPYGMAAGVPTTGFLPQQQVNQSPVLFNTVRRMTDTSVAILPLSKVSFRVGYSQNIFQGPSLSPGYSIGTSDQLLQEYQRNSTDDFVGAILWKPLQLSTLTFEERVDHYKEDSYYTLAPAGQLGRNLVALFGRIVQYRKHGHRLHERQELHHFFGSADRRRPAHRQPGVRCHDELPSLPADARHLPHREPAVPEFAHQEPRPQWRCPVHEGKQQSCPLL